MNWRGRPLLSYEVIINLIGNTRTASGLEVRCDLDLNEYVKGIKVSDEEMDSLNIREDSWHGEWNHVVSLRADS